MRSPLHILIVSLLTMHSLQSQETKTFDIVIYGGTSAGVLSQTRTDPDEDAQWTFEASAAQSMMAGMIMEAGLEVFSGERLRN